MKNNTLKTILLLLIVTTVAFILRFYKLGEFPSGIYVDETSMGYSAYSILETGKDEFSKTLPIVFRSFIAFQAPVYIYLTTLFVNAFGLTKFAVRLPSAVFGTLTVPLLFLLVQSLSPKKIANLLAFLAALTLAISPWHAMFSRAAFEANISVFFLLAGLYTFYWSLGFMKKQKAKPYLLIISASFFAIATTSYLSQRIVIPIILVFLFIRYRKYLLSKPFKKPFVASIILGTLILLPTLSIVFTPGFLNRASISIFGADSVGVVNNTSLRVLVNNKLFLLFREYISLYTTYYSPRSLFFLGDPDQRVSYPRIATFFVWQLPFFIYGIYSLIKNKSLGEIRTLTILLLVVSPLAAATTRDPFSTVRSLALVIPVSILIGYGLTLTYIALKEWFSKRGFSTQILKVISTLFLLLITIYSIANLWSSGIILAEHFRSHYWNHGWKQTVDTIESLESLPIVVDDSRVEVYSQLLFFLKTDPETYQKENFEVSEEEYYSNLNRVKQKIIGNIATRPINWKKDLLVEQYLIGDALAISEDQIKEHDLMLIKEIKYPDQTIAFRILKVPKIPKNSIPII